MEKKEGSPPPPPPPASAGRASDEIGGDGDSACGSPAGNRWPRQETMTLLKIRSDMDPVFREATLKAPLWEQVSRKLSEEGYQRNAKKCKEKFENVFKYHKRTKEARPGKSYRFFTQLEALRSSSSSSAAAALPAPPMSGQEAPSQHTLFSIPLPLPLPLPPATTTPTITPPQTNAIEGPTSSSNTSSFSGTESEEEDNIETSRKRKRKLNVGDEAREEGGKIKSFFQSLIEKVMEQQEKMLQRFLEAIERREHNRMIREEAWRRQEKTRLSRERDIAAQERAAAASRDDAIVSFLQKLTGQTIPIPPPPPTTTTAVLAEEPICSPPPSPMPPPPQQENPVQPPLKETTLALETTTTTSSIRWPKAEVFALIKLRSEMESKYQESIPKGPLWEEISAGMLRLGYNRSSKRCKEKWENINKYFKKVRESNKNRREDTKTCPYFQQLDALYRTKLLVGGGGTADQILSIDDQLAIISPTETASGRQQDDLLGFFEQGSSSVSPVKKPEDIVKKKKKKNVMMDDKKDGSFHQFRVVHYMMPTVLCEGNGQSNLLAMVR